jgi:sorbitol-specific phosphotransferase system component IIBC
MCGKYGVQLMLDTTENESLVHRARNISVARFMQKATQATHFLFIDADVHFEPEAVMRLLSSGHDVSCAVYPKKVIMWEQAAAAISSGKDINKAAAALVMNFKYANSQVVNGFVEVLTDRLAFS